MSLVVVMPGNSNNACAVIQVYLNCQRTLDSAISHGQRYAKLNRDKELNGYELSDRDINAVYAHLEAHYWNTMETIVHMGGIEEGTYADIADYRKSGGKPMDSGNVTEEFSDESKKAIEKLYTECLTLITKKHNDPDCKERDVVTLPWQHLCPHYDGQRDAVMCTERK